MKSAREVVCALLNAEVSCCIGDEHSPLCDRLTDGVLARDLEHLDKFQEIERAADSPLGGGEIHGVENEVGFLLGSETLVRVVAAQPHDPGSHDATAVCFVCSARELIADYRMNGGRRGGG